MKGVVKTQQQWGVTIMKMFSNAPQSLLDEIAVAFGRPRCVGKRYIELMADLDMQMIMGRDWDMTHALSVLRTVYPAGANILAEYMGVQSANVSAAPAAAAPPQSPFASAVASQKTLTVRSLMEDSNLRHFRTSIFIQMDETQGWELFLKRRGLLGGAAMETYISNIKAQWERNRGGEPTMTILSEQARHDSSFASTELSRFAQELIALNIPAVQTEVIKLTSWIDAQKEQTAASSATAYTAQSELRSWLLKNNICDITEVDILIPHLRKAGVVTIDDIRGFDKSELRECGFNPVQAIKILKKLAASEAPSIF
jgi:hypothetical protein